MKLSDYDASFLAYIKLRIKKCAGLDACHVWTGGVDQGNYGLTNYKGKNVRVHRVVACEKYGEIPKGVIVRHKCDNPMCANPDHLELGSHKDNTRDFYERKPEEARARDKKMIAGCRLWSAVRKEAYK
jgi:hypothetical protein